MSWIVRYPDGQEIHFKEGEYLDLKPAEARIQTTDSGITLAIIAVQPGISFYKSQAKITKRT
jgi:hypothetical protein